MHEVRLQGVRLLRGRRPINVAAAAALLAHLENPPLLKFVEQHLEMGDGFSVEVYGTLAAETKEKFNAVGEAVGFPIKYYDTTRVGYTRL